MSEHSELWKHQNNPAGTESVSIFRVLKLDTVRKKEKLYCTKHCGQRLASESEGGRETLHHPAVRVPEAGKNMGTLGIMDYGLQIQCICLAPAL